MLKMLQKGKAQFRRAVLSGDRSYCVMLHTYNIRGETRIFTVMILFSDRQVWANSADPDQTAPGSTLFAIPSASFGCITLR